MSNSNMTLLELVMRSLERSLANVKEEEKLSKIMKKNSWKSHAKK